MVDSGELGKTREIYTNRTTCCEFRQDRWVTEQGLCNVGRHCATLAGVPNSRGGPQCELLGVSRLRVAPNKLGTPVSRSCQAALQTPSVTEHGSCSESPWELRIGNLRVYYDVEEDAQHVVLVRAIGVKERRRVRIGREVIEI